MFLFGLTRQSSKDAYIWLLDLLPAPQMYIYIYIPALPLPISKQVIGIINIMEP